MAKWKKLKKRKLSNKKKLERYREREETESCRMVQLERTPQLNEGRGGSTIDDALAQRKGGTAIDCHRPKALRLVGISWWWGRRRRRRRVTKQIATR
jgi:hypothetical protein